VVGRGKAILLEFKRIIGVIDKKKCQRSGMTVDIIDRSEDFEIMTVTICFVIGIRPVGS
jgi:hypothetical protein